MEKKSNVSFLKKNEGYSVQNKIAIKVKWMLVLIGWFLNWKLFKFVI